MYPTRTSDLMAPPGAMERYATHLAGDVCNFSSPRSGMSSFTSFSTTGKPLAQLRASMSGPPAPAYGMSVKIDQPVFHKSHAFHAIVFTWVFPGADAVGASQSSRMSVKGREREPDNFAICPEKYFFDHVKLLIADSCPLRRCVQLPGERG